MRASAAALESERPAPRPRAFSAALYPMRLLGVGTCLLIGTLYLLQIQSLHGWHLFLLALALVYPHVSRYLSLRIEGRKRLEYVTVLIDAFILGSTVYVVAFADVVMLSLLTVALANGMALGGIRLMAACMLAAALGIALPAWSYGMPAAAQDLIIMNVLASVFLMFYFIMFASVANRRARLLRASRHQVRQQKADLEIEKRKSDGLLWALLPGALVNELHAGREPSPRRYENVTVLAARIANQDEQVSVHGIETVFDELDHCLKAFDEICQRHGLEPYRVFGDHYLAVAGAPEEKTVDTATLVRELKQWTQQRADAQHRGQRVALHFTFAVEHGHAWGGLVHARRFGFELCGGVLERALQATAATHERTAKEAT